MLEYNWRTCLRFDLAPLYCVQTFIATCYIGPSLAVLHNRVPPTLRPGISAVFLLIVNVVGLSLGPLTVGMLSQWTFADGSVHSLRYALAVMQVAGAWGGVHYLLAGWQLGREAAPAH
jgi:hypothetical protein